MTAVECGDSFPSRATASIAFLIYKVGKIHDLVGRTSKYWFFQITATKIFGGFFHLRTWYLTSEYSYDRFTTPYWVEYSQCLPNPLMYFLT